TIRLQVRSILQDEIHAGVYLPNQRIPSERALAERYRISRASVREAIAEMISSGALYRAGGRGTFVSASPPLEVSAAQHPRQLGFWISSEIFHFVQSGYTRILTGVEEVFRAQGYALDFHSVDEEPDSLQPTAAGHIIAGGVRSSTLERLQNSGTPLVVV